ncbi:MAG: PolC-type DNA polymerase III [Clostridiales bacterium]|nr:PolC-type DNA polymerase III [Clostridiales bacterium]
MANAKDFFTVFPDLKLTKVLNDLFLQVQVEKIVACREANSIKVHIYSEKLIENKDLTVVTKAMKDQLFSNGNITVSINCRFKLSDMYTPKNLYEAYKESILEEIRNTSIIMYTILKKDKIEFEGNDMIISVEETTINCAKLEDLRKILQEIFNDRCDVNVNISFKMIEPVLDKYTKKNEIISENQSKLISRQFAIVNSKNEEGENNVDSIVGGDGSTKNNDDTKESIKDAGKETEKNTGKTAEDTKSAGKGKFGDSQKKVYGNYRREKFTTRADNPDVIFGRSFDGDIMPLSEVNAETGETIIHGEIISVETREIRNERTIVTFSITDYTDSIKSKLFVKNDELVETLDGIKKGNFIKLKGICMFDTYDKEVSISSVVGIMKGSDFRVKRMDLSVDKRVELHCHTKMSDMDGVSDAASIINQAVSWGHKALAITDHGNVQGFTEALHAIDNLKWKYKSQDKTLDFKVIYGVEAYLVDDLKGVVTDSKGQNIDETYIVFDLETTGLSALTDSIIEIGAVKIQGGKIVDHFSEFVNPQKPIPYKIENLTGISDEMVLDAQTIDDVLPRFLDFCKDSVMVAHNADFDMSFILHNAKKLGIPYDATYVDTVAMARILIPTIARYKLDNVAKALGIPLEHHHRAVDDAGCTAKIFVKFIEMLKEREIFDLDALNEFSKSSPESIKKMPTHHAIIIATNEVGRVNLYRLVSDAHIKYFNRFPRIPKSAYLKYKEGLIIGSACEAGELYQAVYGGKSDAQITRLVNFYDYLEIQPLGNNQFMIDKGNATIEELKDINRRIVELGEKFNKPVVATCDVHFLNPEDEVYRRIIMAGKGFDDADKQPPLFLRTTQEMLAEFAYLGSDKAYEVVVTNTNKISDMVENISPIFPDKAPPVIPNSDEILRTICYNTAHSMYGENLPDIVTERLERELNSIISNGFAVMYIIAQKLVWKSNEDGYLVGSRGSVGSSFVATMAGITEVNPLRPHYLCRKCYYVDFDSEDVKKYVGGAGCDMPDKACPVCGEPLTKEGFDIPFETFLGFKGNKEPDIDLNFSGEYQSKAHEYTEVIFGKGQTFRAGTIGTLAEKTAYGYVKGYYEDRGITKRSCEIERIAKGCVGVRRTTGQHPGGIIVLPYGNEIYTFTPVQRPANDMTTKTVTTHFDYHSIDHNLLKLDILGHDDPTMIRMLEDLTGLDAKTIPLDNQEVMSLFASTDALGITPKDLDGCPLGSLGIPEFGTEFVIQMLIDTQPKTFSDLVRISGLSHGTDVWLGNAQTLIEEGKATISTAICTRDDIMTYLINKGMDSELSFTIMESVRKGKGLKPEWEEAMLANDVPEWYIWSCKKIKYMFPKAHAAAYVMMAYRIAYFKVFYPLAYYAAYFSIRASAFNYEIMCQGKDKLQFFIEDYKRRKDTLTPKEQETVKDMKVVQEMYARGLEFAKVDLYNSLATRFQIVDGKLLPPFATIDGMGDKAAEAVVEAAKDGKFLSRDDFRQRTKVSKTVIDMMNDMGLFGDLPESNQLSLFDL